MSNSRLVCFIDEAGCSGDQYGKGSSQFLVVAGVVMARKDLGLVDKFFEECRQEKGVSKTFSKFSKCGDRDKFLLTRRMGQFPIRIVQIAVHKPSMDGSYTRKNHNKEYQYLCKLLVERVSWIARDSAKNHPHENNQCQLIFSEQTMYPYEDIQVYFSKLRNGKRIYNNSAAWEHIEEYILSTPHQNEMAIHLADIAASALHMAIEPKTHGMTDDRFQRNLHPTIYRKNNKFYGLKVYPMAQLVPLIEQGLFPYLVGK